MLLFRRPDRTFLKTNRPLNIAHRGGRGLSPEHTIFAYKKALQVGADVLEIDVHSTKDGEIVVIHDPTVDRTTDGTGRVREFTSLEIKRLDAGYRFVIKMRDKEDYPFRGKGLTIPTLKEVFSEFPNQRINIEIKQFEPQIEDAIFRVIKEMNMTDNVLVVSESREAIKRFRRISKGIIATGASVPEVRRFVIFMRLRMMPLYMPAADAFQIPEYHGDYHLLTEGFIEKAHKKNIKIHVWTVNKREDMERLIKMGINGIMTDYPDILAEAISKPR
ncbi:MAG: glycerophosphodiester phosphodiesterase [Nitrospirae bacterium]|nr:glycerophosphodiester phosphodiesterase [Nitrospirota bacterium]